jgi:hypothetical protein
LTAPAHEGLSLSRIRLVDRRGGKHCPKRRLGRRCTQPPEEGGSTKKCHTSREQTRTWLRRGKICLDTLVCDERLLCSAEIDSGNGHAYRSQRHWEFNSTSSGRVPRPPGGYVTVICLHFPRGTRLGSNCSPHSSHTIQTDRGLFCSLAACRRATVVASDACSGMSSLEGDG